MESSKNSPQFSIISHGVETSRYNSLIAVQVAGKSEFAIYTCGNRLVLFDIDLKEILID